MISLPIPMCTLLPQINPVQSAVGAQELCGCVDDAFRSQPRLGRAVRHRRREEAVVQTSCKTHACDHPYKASMSVNYDSIVLLTSKVLIFTTLQM